MDIRPHKKDSRHWLHRPSFLEVPIVERAGWQISEAAGQLVRRNVEALSTPQALQEGLQEGLKEGASTGQVITDQVISTI